MIPHFKLYVQTSHVSAPIVGQINIRINNTAEILLHVYDTDYEWYGRKTTSQLLKTTYNFKKLHTILKTLNLVH